MRRDKKLLIAACGIISLISQTSEIQAQTRSKAGRNNSAEDDRPTKGGSSSKAGLVQSQDNVGAPKGGSQVESPSRKGGGVSSALSCSWVASPKVIETNCEGSKKKMCFGEANCSEGSGAVFRTEVSCSLGKAGGGVAFCADATACAESPTGIGTESCNIVIYKDGKAGSAFQEPQRRANTKEGTR
jgi:hypothetical protein